MKTCIHCGELKPLAEFHKDKNKKDGKRIYCKGCASARARKYREQNREKETARNKEYYEQNKEEIAAQQKEYREQNKEEIAARRKEYYEQNREKEVARHKKYREQNREEIAARNKKKSYLPSLSEDWLDKLLPEDGADITIGIITVRCKLCNKEMLPTRIQLKNRVSAINGKKGGENGFYCSDSCKDACPVYMHDPNHIDPRIAPDKDDKQHARACQTDHLKRLQCADLGHSECEKCGDIIDVELHHTLPVAEYGAESINSAGHMLLCPGCHTETHRACV